MLHDTPLQIPTRPKKAARDTSARFGRSDGFRQQVQQTNATQDLFSSCVVSETATQIALPWREQYEKAGGPV
jgi:hypothetical protein